MMMPVYIKAKLIDVFVVCEDVDMKVGRRRIAFDGLGKEDGKSWMRFWFQLLPVHMDLFHNKWLICNDAFIITVRWINVVGLLFQGNSGGRRSRVQYY